MSTNRRDFLKTTAAVGAVASLSAASYGRVAGTADQVRVAFIGTGGRCQDHITAVMKMVEENKPVRPVAVCDVWDGQVVPRVIRGRGLYPSARKVNIKEDDKEHIVKDYRRILDLKDVDVVSVATPDHWHARIAMDAMLAGKDVYCEKPMTRTIEEAQAVVDTWKKTGRTMTVGVQSMADPTWSKAHDYIAGGNIGKVLQGQTSYFRNSSVGQWRYYPLTKEMSPKTIDWDMWLGHKFDVNGAKLGPTPEQQPFDRAIWAQWRCYWPFGGGMFTDLFVHQTTHLLAAMGLRYPARVVGGGGIYMEYDGRDVPDVATVVADFDEGCQVIITATMCNDHRIEEVIRGHTGTLRFVTKESNLMEGFEVLPQHIGASPSGPGGQKSQVGNMIHGDFEGNDEHLTYALYENFLHCASAKKQDTLCSPELGAAAFTTVNMGVLSYRQGRALFWDKEKRRAVNADASWAQRWQDRSKKHGTPNHVMGWHADDKGSTLEPPAYQKLEGPWVNGKDPAAG